MKPARRVAALLGLLLLPAACGRSCGCVEGKKTYETLTGKFKVELVRNVHWAGGRIPGPVTEFMIRVHTTPVFDEPITCSHVDLAEEEAGRFVGYRCHGQKLWTIIRLRGGDRRLVQCDAPVGEGRKPDFRLLGTLSASADGILECPTPYTGVHRPRGVWSELATSIAEDEGNVSAALFLARTAERPLRTTLGDAWGDAFKESTSAVRAGALVPLCASFTSGDALPQVYARGARLCSFEGPTVGDGAVVQLRKLLRVDMTGDMVPSRDVAIAWASVLAAEKTPVDAGEVACAAIPDVSSHDEHAVTRVHAIAAVVARTKARCAAVIKWFDPALCSDELDCDGGALCDHAGLAPELEEWAKTAKAAPADRHDPALLRTERVRLAALLVQGKLDRETLVRNARRHYTTHEVDGGAVPRACHDAESPNGAPCKCDRALTSFACEIPAAETRQSRGPCAFHIDDVHRRFDDVRRSCSARGESCADDRVCCANFRCSYGGNSRCIADEPVEAGARDAH